MGIDHRSVVYQQRSLVIGGRRCQCSAARVAFDRQVLRIYQQWKQYWYTQPMLYNIACSFYAPRDIAHRILNSVPTLDAVCTRTPSAGQRCLGICKGFPSKRLSFERMEPKFENASSGTTRKLAGKGVHGHRQIHVCVQFVNKFLGTEKREVFQLCVNVISLRRRCETATS